MMFEKLRGDRERCDRIGVGRCMIFMFE